MANIGITLPHIAANTTFSTRDTGGSWSSETSMTHGFAEPTSSFSSPVCDELRITATYSASTEFDRCFVSTMNILAGLSFSLYIDATNFTYSQDTELYPERRQSQNYKFTPTSGTVVVLTITGIGQASLNFGQIVFGKLSFTPTMNIQAESSLRESKDFVKEVTSMGFIQRLEQSARQYSCEFLKLTDVELKGLRKLIDVRANYGFVLFELDQSVDDVSNAFCCYSSLIEESPRFVDFNSATMRILEAYSRG